MKVVKYRWSWSFGRERAKAYMRQMLDHVGRGLTVLDIGGQDGYASSNVRHLASFTTVDILPEGDVCADLQSLPFVKNAFDWGFTSHTLEHVPNLDRAWSEIKRVCRYGCWVVVPLEDFETFMDKQGPEGHVRHFENADGWLELLKCNEFTVISDSEDLICLCRF